MRFLERDGWELSYDRAGNGPPIVLLHATLASSADYATLIAQLAATHTVIAVDRRGSGQTRPPAGEALGPIGVGAHVSDLHAVLVAERLEHAVILGHSYGGCLALEFAARCPGLVAGVWAFEPPYAPVAPPEIRERLGDVGRRTAAAGAVGATEAAEAFLAAVTGDGAIDRLSPATREQIRGLGRAAIADAALLGLAPRGLGRIRCPVVVATGTASDPAYAAIAAALVQRTHGAVHVSIDGAGHGAPIARASLIASSIAAFSVRCR